MHRLITVILLCTSFAAAQNAAPSNSSAAQAPAQNQKRVTALTPGARLSLAKTVFIRKAGGNPIPYNVISDSMEGWGRLTILDSPDKADIILEVSAPDEGGTTVSAGSKNSPISGYPEQSTSSSRSLSSGPVKLVAIDTKTNLPVWTATEQPKFALKQKAREDNLFDAAQKLFNRFHDRIEATAHP